MAVLQKKAAICCRVAALKRGVQYQMNEKKMWKTIISTDEYVRRCLPSPKRFCVALCSNAVYILPRSSCTSKLFTSGWPRVDACASSGRVVVLSVYTRDATLSPGDGLWTQSCANSFGEVEWSICSLHACRFSSQSDERTYNREESRDDERPAFSASSSALPMANEHYENCSFHLFIEYNTHGSFRSKRSTR